MVSWKITDLILAAQCFKWFLVEDQTHGRRIEGETLRERLKLSYHFGK